MPFAAKQHQTTKNNKMRHVNIFSRIWRFYRDGFRQMTWGRTLWGIILVKLVIMFVILRWIFFPNFLNVKTREDGTTKSHYVGTELVERARQNN